MNPKCKILIVEDEFIIAMSLQERLIAQGYDVPAIASSGETAIEYFHKLHPQVILMDVVLNGKMDGIDASQQIRENSTVPILFCSAYSDVQTMQRISKIPDSDFILKPISEAELDKKLDFFVGDS